MLRFTKFSSVFLAVLPPVLLRSATVASAAFVYNPSEWPAINGDIKTGSGAPPPGTNAAFTAAVGYVPAAGAPPVRKLSENPNTGGVCPTNGSFGVSGSCWWTCGYGSDNYPCTGPDDVKLCQPGKWALSYDDGPTNNTDALLAKLKAYNLKATFCLIGSQVVRYPDQAKRIADAGHDLCVHTWSHSALTTQSDEQIIAEFKWTEKAIQAATGIRPKYARAPFGDMDNRVRAITKKMGYTMLYWLYDNSDYTTYPPTPTANTSSIIAGMDDQLTKISMFPNGLIFLSHPERYSYGVDLADYFLKNASPKVSLVRVSDCLNDKTPYFVDASATSSSSISPIPTTAQQQQSSASRIAQTAIFIGSSGVIGALIMTLVVKVVM